MTMWHGYFVVERGTVGVENWDSLMALFAGMGTGDSSFPAYNLHSRTRLDGDAVIYESQFNPGEVSIVEFKQMLADEFSVPIENIVCNTSSVNYAGYTTPVWDFTYNAISRFVVRRFGNGGDWNESGAECRGYLIVNKEEWETEL